MRMSRVLSLDPSTWYLTLFRTLDRFVSATSLDVRLVHIALLTPMGIFGSRYQEIGMYAEEANRELEAAGRPHVKVPFPAGVETCLKWGSYFPRLMKGDLDDPDSGFGMDEHGAKIELLGPYSENYEDVMARFDLARACEASWEPHHSARVSAWRRRVTEWIIKHKGPKYTLVRASIKLPCLIKSDCLTAYCILLFAPTAHVGE